MARARSAPLTRDEIVAAAIRTANDGALSTLSMRGLAESLNVSAMALYAHVADKDEILDEILDHALASEARPAAPNGDWRNWMLAFAEQLHHVLLDRPELLDRYCRRPVGVPTALERMEAALAVLTAAGFDDAAAVDVFATVQTVTLGFTALEAARRSSAVTTQTKRGARPQFTFDPGSPHYWPAYFATLPPDRFPHLVRSRPDMAAFTSSDRFRQVLTSLLDGITPRRRRRSDTTSQHQEVVR